MRTTVIVLCLLALAGCQGTNRAGTSASDSGETPSAPVIPTAGNYLSALDGNTVSPINSPVFVRLTAFGSSNWTNDSFSTMLIEGQAVHIYEHDYSDRKSTRLNSSHMSISYAVFCLK